MKIKDVRKLAENSLQNGKVNEKIARFVINNLSQKELVLYIKFLKQEIEKSTVQISSSEKLDPSVKKELENMYKDKNIRYTEDPKLGPGIIIRDNDNVLNLTLKQQIHNIVESVTENL